MGIVRSSILHAENQQNLIVDIAVKAKGRPLFAGPTFGKGHEDSMRQTAASTIAGRMLTATFLVCVGTLAVAYCNAQGLDVVYVPTPRETVDRMLQVTEVGSSDYVIDLGSGDGRIAIAAGRLGARALGVDLDPARIQDAQQNAKRAGVTDRVTFRQQNLFETDLSQATVLTMYLLPSINVKLRPKILALRPGTRVVSHDFTMGDWKADLTETDNWRIHFWIVPARVEGKWQVRDGNRAFNLTINQTYQQFQGMASADGRTVPLRNTRLRAANIEFTVDLDGQAATLRGIVNGDRMQGRSSAGTEWIATRS